MQTTLGGDRLGSGNKQEIHLKNYERSTHDLSNIIRTTMSSGTLVPFMKQLALPGDSFTIDLNCEVLTHPTIGPLFGSYKVQLDMFKVPMSLYNAKLNMNMIKVGLDMAQIKIPLVRLQADYPNTRRDLDNQQINPSSIWAYLGIRGLGTYAGDAPSTNPVYRTFNAIPWLAYWDIYKNYYANKQEEIGAVIHNDLRANDYGDPIISATWIAGHQGNNEIVTESNILEGNPIPFMPTPQTLFRIVFTTLDELRPETVYVQWHDRFVKAVDMFDDFQLELDTNSALFSAYNMAYVTGAGGLQSAGRVANFYIDNGTEGIFNTSPNVTTFPLDDIDEMRIKIMTSAASLNAVTITSGETLYPYRLALKTQGTGYPNRYYSAQSSQEGLALKTYQSDLFNNWISTEWLDGDNGVNEITAVTIVDDKFTIDQLNLQSKIYNMLNRIAVSGGSYDDWLDATYTHERPKRISNPIYIGGLSKELVFQEVVSNAGTSTDQGDQPLGTLAGRGKLNNKHKGGHIEVRVDEPCYIMGIVSITPRIDYSQGNDWDMNLKTWNDFHKPALDEIGFQDLITDQFAWWDTKQEDSGGATIFKSAGKQPAWINYMTNVNKILGNFAIQNEQMFMVLNRRYEPLIDPEGTGDLNVSIKDLTTYIDPTKFNHIFANTRLDAQNFWVQIGCNITARRKMSAKVIPNL